jgi:tryptophan aminotransferase
MADDPYYYLYYGEGARSPSYFTLERELLPVVGRVLRFDSLSKILSAGIRVGFATGPTALIDAIDANVRLTLPFRTHFLTRRLR